MNYHQTEEQTASVSQFMMIQLIIFGVELLQDVFNVVMTDATFQIVEVEEIKVANQAKDLNLLQPKQNLHCKNNIKTIMTLK